VTKKTRITSFSLRVFISYSHEDRDFVSKLVWKLRDEDIDVWIDQFEIMGGESIIASVQTGIENNDVFLVIVSKNSMRSAWVQEELNMIFSKVIEHKSVVIPILIDKQSVMPIFLRNKRRVDFSRNFKSGFFLLLKTLRRRWKHKADKLVLSMENEFYRKYSRSPAKLSKSLAALGNISISSGNMKQATRILAKSISLSSTNIDAKNLLAIAFINKEDFHRAEILLRQMLKKGTQKGRASYNLACLYSVKSEKLLSKGTSIKLVKELTNKSLKYLKKAVSLNFIYWLGKYDSRRDPVGDIASDPDLFFARQYNDRFDEFITSLIRNQEHEMLSSSVHKGNRGCLSGDAYILTPSGKNTKMRNIKCGDKIVNGFSRKPSYVWRKMRLWECAGVVINDKLDVSSNQHVLTTTGWRAAMDLKIGDNLINIDKLEITVTEIRSWKKPREIFHLNVNGHPSFVANGFILHNSKK